MIAGAAMLAARRAQVEVAQQDLLEAVLSNDPCTHCGRADEQTQEVRLRGLRFRVCLTCETQIVAALAANHQRVIDVREGRHHG